MCLPKPLGLRFTPREEGSGGGSAPVFHQPLDPSPPMQQNDDDDAHMTQVTQPGNLMFPQSAPSDVTRTDSVAGAEAMAANAAAAAASLPARVDPSYATRLPEIDHDDFDSNPMRTHYSHRPSEVGRSVLPEGWSSGGCGVT